jgi:Zn-dependent peptidase ImmA (M78 family)
VGVPVEDEPVAPKIPARLRVGTVTYELDCSGGRITRAGITVSMHGVMSIDTDMPADQQRQTLLHEVLHAVFDNGIATLLCDGKDDLDELIVQMLTEPLLAVLRDNPDLLVFLLGDE